VRIAVIGAGGVGGYFGARWAEAGHDVTLIARGAHLEAIRARGVRLVSPAGDAVVPVPAVEDTSAVGPVEAALVATKTWQLPDAAGHLRALVGPDTVVFGAQNGVEAPDQLAAVVGREKVLGGTCRIIAFIAEPGVIKHVGVEPTLLVGELDGGDSARTKALAAALDVGPAARLIVSPDIRAELWRKFLFFAPMSGTGAVTRATVGAIRKQAETRAMLRAAFEEVYAVSVAAGIGLTEDVVDTIDAFVDTLPHDGTSSLQRDFDAGRRTELEALAGAMVRLGLAHSVPTPTHDFLYAALLPLERRARGETEW
jgi:2-dehydropantoate 2-reductase